MKKLILVVLTLGMSISTSALASPQKNAGSDVFTAISEQTDTFTVITRPRPPRPPQIVEQKIELTIKSI